ncbi:MAG TPA: creatininase family protein [Candidatus Desulfaltia sp.]|nr:creatininase family protein [Candidatus Desulfaltia sp.]
MVQLAEVSWAEAEKLFRENDTVILPVGSTEQHGPHNPLGTDHLIAAAFSKAVGDRAGVLVLPVVPVGISEHHRQFPGTLWVPPEVFRDYMLSVALAAASHGARKILFFNGHGGNTAALIEVAGALRRDFDVFAAVLMTFPPGIDGHAGSKETSMNLYYHGHLVKMDKAVDTTQSTHLGSLPITGISNLGSMQFPWDTVDLTPTGVLGSAGKKIVSTTATSKIGEEIMMPFTDEVVKLVEAIKKADVAELLSKPHKMG